MVDNPDNQSDQPKPGEKPEEVQGRWIKELDRSQKYYNDFIDTADKLVRLYRKQETRNSARRRFAMLWSNTELLKPTLYSQPPKPEINRRFEDKDPIGLLVSMILERCAEYQMECGHFDEAMRLARNDVILPGRGVVWVRRQNEDMLSYDYVHWRDYLTKPGRNWSEVTWIGKRSYFSRGEMKQRFKGLTESALGLMAPDNVPKTGLTDAEKKALEGKYSVWEIWDKTTAKVYFIAPSAKKPLEVVDPLYQLKDFFPTPMPLYASMTSDSLVPVPDYKFYQDQAEEIDDLTRRIASLTDSLKLVGFYPKGAEDASQAIETALSPHVENKMIGIESWAAFGERGGANAIIFLPIKQVADTITACVELRRQLIEDVYQITGLSDILRGSTDPHETLGAQELKAQTGSIRIRDRQREVQRFGRDLVRISCEIMAETFEPQQLLAMANMLTPEYAQRQEEIAQAFQLMADDRLRSFRLDVETDSMIQPDENKEKQQRTEFAMAVGSMLKEALPLAQMVPELLPMIGQVLLFVTRGFRTARELEKTIEDTIGQLVQKAQQAAQQPPQPSPEQIKAEATQKELQMRGQMMEQEMALKQRGQEAELQHKQATQAMDIQHKQALHDQQLQLATTANQNQMAIEQDGAGQKLRLEQQAAEQQQAQAAAAALQQQAQQASASSQQLEATQAMDAQKLQQGQALAEQGLRERKNIALIDLAKAKETMTGEPAAMPAVDTGGEGLPQAPDPLQVITEAFQQAIAQLAQVIAAQNQQLAQAMTTQNQQLAQLLTAPKSITTPDGRIYTAQPQIAGEGDLNGASNPNF